MLIFRHKDSPDPIPRGTFQRGVLDGAIERARYGIFPPAVKPDLFIRTAFLIRGIAGEHAFANGCKRTGLMVAGITLYLNGYRLKATQEEAVKFMMGVADQTISDPIEMAEWLRGHAVKTHQSLWTSVMQKLKDRKN